MIIKVKNIKASLVIALIMLALSSLVVISPFATLQFALFAVIRFPPILPLQLVWGDYGAFGFIVLFISGLIKLIWHLHCPLAYFRYQC